MGTLRVRVNPVDREGFLYGNNLPWRSSPKRQWVLRREGSQVTVMQELAFYGILEDWESYLWGVKAFDRARGLPGAEASQHHAECLLVQEQGQRGTIPEVLQDRWLVFLETVWFVPREDEGVVPILRCEHGIWKLDFDWLEREWTERLLIARAFPVAA